MFADCALFSVVTVMAIYFQCYFGARLDHKSNQLVKKMFQSNWIEQNQQLKCFLLIFGQQTQKPITLVAGGLFRVDLTTCLAVHAFDTPFICFDL